MKRLVRLSALVLALGAAGWWLAAGANLGWTKTSVPKAAVDEVTGIEAIEYQKRFVPGVDLLGGAVLAAAAMAGVSFLLRTKDQN